MNILLVGIEPENAALFKKIESETPITHIQTLVEFETLLNSYQGTPFEYIAVGLTIPEMSALELAQSMRGIYPESRIIFISSDKKGYSREQYMKNGYDETYILPGDSSVLKKELVDFLNFSKSQEKLKPVRLVDLKAGDILTFNIYVYFEKNKKYILYCKVGNPIEGDRLERLKKHHLDIVFVPEAQIKMFYTYSAKKMKDLYNDGKSMGQTEKLEVLQKEVRTMFHSLIEDQSASDFDSGKEVLENCKNIISLFLNNNPQENWYDNMINSISIEEFDSYSHSVHTSIFTCLLAIGLGLPDVENFALAGLFHDVGLISHAHLLALKSKEGLSPEDLAVYEKHPSISLSILKEKRIILPPMVQKMIEQHHENLLGTGFPNKIKAEKLTQEAQVLAIANELDRRTRHTNEQKQKPLEIIADLTNQHMYDLNLLKRIENLFKVV